MNQFKMQVVKPTGVVFELIGSGEEQFKKAKEMCMKFSETLTGLWEIYVVFPSDSEKFSDNLNKFIKKNNVPESLVPIFKKYHKFIMYGK